MKTWKFACEIEIFDKKSSKWLGTVITSNTLEHQLKEVYPMMSPDYCEIVDEAGVGLIEPYINVDLEKFIYQICYSLLEIDKDFSEKWQDYECLARKINSI